MRTPKRDGTGVLPFLCAPLISMTAAKLNKAILVGVWFLELGMSADICFTALVQHCGWGYQSKGP